MGLSTIENYYFYVCFLFWHSHLCCYQLIFYILCIRFPVLAPACQNLVVFGNPHKLLAEAEEELATLPQLATEDMFITEHYFIMTSPYGNAIVLSKRFYGFTNTLPCTRFCGIISASHIHCIFPQISICIFIVRRTRSLISMVSLIIWLRLIMIFWLVSVRKTD